MNGEHLAFFFVLLWFAVVEVFFLLTLVIKLGVRTPRYIFAVFGI